MKALCLLLLAGILVAQSPPAPPRLGVVVYEDDQAGVVVEQVRKHSAAAKAGLKVGDRIVKLGDIEVKEDADLVKALSAARPGHTTALEVVRGDERTRLSITFSATAPKKPADDEPVAAAKKALLAARKALAGKTDDPAVAKALIELAKAEKALGKLGRPGPLAGGPAKAPSGDIDKVMKRVEELIAGGATREEAEQIIAEEFPGFRIKIGGGDPDEDW